MGRVGGGLRLDRRRLVGQSGRKPVSKSQSAIGCLDVVCLNRPLVPTNDLDCSGPEATAQSGICEDNVGCYSLRLRILRSLTTKK